MAAASTLEVGGARVEKAGWRFHDPFDGLGQGHRGLVVLRAALLDRRLDRVRARPQEGGCYGGWITPGVGGPFKGGEGA